MKRQSCCVIDIDLTHPLSQIPGYATAANSVKMDKYLKKRVAQCWSEDNTSLQANIVVVVTCKRLQVKHFLNLSPSYTAKMYSKNYEFFIIQVSKSAQISAWKCTKSVRRPVSARTRWGANSAPPDLIAGGSNGVSVCGIISTLVRNSASTWSPMGCGSLGPCSAKAVTGAPLQKEVPSSYSGGERIRAPSLSILRSEGHCPCLPWVANRVGSSENPGGWGRPRLRPLLINTPLWPSTLNLDGRVEVAVSAQSASSSDRYSLWRWSAEVWER